MSESLINVKEIIQKYEQKVWDPKDYARAYGQYLANKSQTFTDMVANVQSVVAAVHDRSSASLDILGFLLRDDVKCGYAGNLSDLIPNYGPINFGPAYASAEAACEFVRNIASRRAAVVVSDLHQLDVGVLASYPDDVMWSDDDDRDTRWLLNSDATSGGNWIEVLTEVFRFRDGVITVSGNYVATAAFMVSLLGTRDGVTNTTDPVIPEIVSQHAETVKHSVGEAIDSLRATIESAAVASSALVAISETPDDIQMQAADLKAKVEAKITIKTVDGYQNLSKAMDSLTGNVGSLSDRVNAYTTMITDSLLGAADNGCNFNPVIQSGEYSVTSPAAILANAYGENATVNAVVDVAVTGFAAVGQTIWGFLQKGAEWVGNAYNQYVAPVLENRPLEFQSGRGAWNEYTFAQTFTTRELVDLSARPGVRPEDETKNLLRLMIAVGYADRVQTITVGTDSVIIDALSCRDHETLCLDSLMNRLVSDAAFVRWDSGAYDVCLGRTATGETVDLMVTPVGYAEPHAVTIPVWRYQMYVYLKASTIEPMPSFDAPLGEHIDWIMGQDPTSTPTTMRHCVACTWRNAAVAQLVCALDLLVRDGACDDQDGLVDANVSLASIIATSGAEVEDTVLDGSHNYHAVHLSDAHADNETVNAYSDADWGNATLAACVVIGDVEPLLGTKRGSKVQRFLRGLLEMCVVSALSNKVDGMLSYLLHSAGQYTASDEVYTNVLSELGTDWSPHSYNDRFEASWDAEQLGVRVTARVQDYPLSDGYYDRACWARMRHSAALADGHDFKAVSDYGNCGYPVGYRTWQLTNFSNEVDGGSDRLSNWLWQNRFDVRPVVRLGGRILMHPDVGLFSIGAIASSIQDISRVLASCRTPNSGCFVGIINPAIAYDELAHAVYSLQQTKGEYSWLDSGVPAPGGGTAFEAGGMVYVANALYAEEKGYEWLKAKGGWLDKLAATLRIPGRAADYLLDLCDCAYAAACDYEYEGKYFQIRRGSYQLESLRDVRDLVVIDFDKAICPWIITARGDAPRPNPVLKVCDHHNQLSDYLDGYDCECTYPRISVGDVSLTIQASHCVYVGDIDALISWEPTPSLRLDDPDRYSSMLLQWWSFNAGTGSFHPRTRGAFPCFRPYVYTAEQPKPSCVIRSDDAMINRADAIAAAIIATVAAIVIAVAVITVGIVVKRLVAKAVRKFAVRGNILDTQRRQRESELATRYAKKREEFDTQNNIVYDKKNRPFVNKEWYDKDGNKRGAPGPLDAFPDIKKGFKKIEKDFGVGAMARDPKLLKTLGAIRFNNLKTKIVMALGGVGTAAAGTAGAVASKSVLTGGDDGLAGVIQEVLDRIVSIERRIGPDLADDYPVIK